MTKRAGLGTVLVIGVGNAWRGDDAVGLQAARRLRVSLGPSVEVIDAEGDGLAILDLMEGIDHVILIDAVKGGGQPGTTVRLDLSVGSRWGTVVPCSTHAMGIADAIDLARALGRLPKQIILYGIEIESVESGAPISDAVREGLDIVVEQVYREVRGHDA
ncbi:MAG: hydrogenase maturation protease [Nitrospirota bacterium]|nr:hydrogenase maturation protease [Nitrospirota bacterium]